MRRWIVWAVLGIIALVAAAIGLFVFNSVRVAKTQTLCAVVARNLARRVEEASDKKLRVEGEDVQRFATEIEARNNRTGLISTDDMGAPLDPWGNKLLISSNRIANQLRIEVRSVGRDGMPGTADDLATELWIESSADSQK